MADHIHTPHDGRGLRDVYLNGVKLKRVVYADTKRGIVRMHHDPIKVCRRREVARTYKRRGIVKVVLRG